MIISHRHRFIFLKTRKTAGTSLDIALSSYCGPEDIITPLGWEDEDLRSELGFPGPRNFGIPLSCWTVRDGVKRVLKGKIPSYTEHMSAKSLKARIRSGVWSTYLKFCVERNPFDKAISLYYWRTRNATPRPPLREFLETVDEQSLSNFHLYGIGERIVVDHVLRYEQLEQGLEFISKELGLDGIVLPHAKSEFRSDRRPYRELMTSEEREIVAKACAREIRLLGYEY